MVLLQPFPMILIDPIGQTGVDFFFVDLENCIPPLIDFRLHRALVEQPDLETLVVPGRVIARGRVTSHDSQALVVSVCSG